MVGRVTTTQGTVLKGHSLRKVENHRPRESTGSKSNTSCDVICMEGGRLSFEDHAIQPWIAWNSLCRPGCPQGHRASSASAT